MERLYAIVVFCLGLAILWQGRPLAFGSFRNPGSGMFPALIAVMMMVLAVILFAIPPKTDTRASPISGRVVLRICSVFAALVLYAVLLEFLGFLIVSFVLATFLFAVFDSQKYRFAVLKAFVLTGLAYILFEVLLHSNLPRGLLNF
ncbi:MAG: tripartite tricarboxylate transporter TctB family protein [Thermodesulfobacteriota bacterium]